MSAPMPATDESSALATRQHGGPRKRLLCNTLVLRRQTESDSDSSCESESESSETEVDESSGHDRSNSQERLDLQATSKPAIVDTLLVPLTRAQSLLKTQLNDLRNSLKERQNSFGPSHASGAATRNDTSTAAKKPASLAAFTATNSRSQSSFDAAYKALEVFDSLAFTGEGLDSGRRFRRANACLTTLQLSCLGGNLTCGSPDFTEADYKLEARIAALRYTALRLTLGDELEGTGSVEDLYAECDELDRKIAFSPSREVLESLTGYNFAVPTWDGSQHETPAQVDRLLSHGCLRAERAGEVSGSVAPGLI